MTLFPEIFPSVLNASLLGKAQKNDHVSFQVTQIRDFATDKHRTVDGSPYGGGAGMLMRSDVLYDAWKSTGIETGGARSLTVLLSPQGRLFDQALAREFSSYSKIVFVCGHYEGVDERFIEQCVDQEVSIGNYVLMGGELPALVMAETIARLIPGVVGNEESLSGESLENGLLKYPQYTRPRVFQGREVPEILLSGDHQAIRAWREAQSKSRTQQKRPDLWAKFIKQNT